MTLESPEGPWQIGAPVSRRGLKFAIVPQFSSRMTPDAYKGASAFLTERMGQPIEVVGSQDYGRFNSDIRDGDTAMGITGSGPYVLGQREFGLVPLAVPVIGGQQTHRSCLVVRAGSSVRTLADLRGQSFAFTDPLSIAGGLVPACDLVRLGTTSGKFFRRITYTHNHHRSIQAVADGLVDGATVNSLVLDTALRSNPELQRKLRVVSRSRAFANGPVVVHPRTPRTFRHKLRTVLLGMGTDPAGKAVLAAMGLGGFVAAAPDQYKTVEAMLRISGAL